MSTTLDPAAPPSPVAPRPSTAVKATLIGTGLMTIMAGATVSPALPAIREAFAGTPNAQLLAGLVLSLHALAIVVFSPFAGWLGDRFGRRPALLAGLAAFGLGGSSAFYLPDLPTILAGRVVLGVGVSLIMTAGMGLIGDLFTGEERAKLIGAQVAVATGGGVVLLLGAGALASLDWRVTFLIYLAGLVMMLPVLRWVPRTPPPAPSTKDAPKGMLGAWLIPPLLASLLVQIVFYLIPTHVPSLVTGAFGYGPFLASVVIATMTVTMTPVALSYKRISSRLTPPVVVAVSFAFVTAGYAVISAAPNVWTLVAGLVVAAGGLGLVGPNLNGWMVALAPAQVRGRAAGLLTTATFSGQFLSPVIAQPIIDAAGIQPAFLVVAGVSVLGAVGYAVFARFSARAAAAA